MKTSSTINYLYSFQNTEWESFYKYVSIYHSSSSPIYELTHFLYTNKKVFVQYSSEKITETNESIRAKYQPSIKKQSFANLMSSFKIVIENFLVQQEALQTPELYEVLKMKALARKGMTAQYAMNSHESEIINSEKISIWQDLYALLIYHFEYYYNLYPDPKVNRITFTNMLVRFRSMTSKLSQMYLVELKNREELLHEKYDTTLLEFLDFHADQESQFKPIAKLLLDIITIKEEDSYSELKEILYTSDNLSHEIRYAILSYLTSYLNTQIIDSKQDRKLELLKLYHYGLEKGIIIYGEKLPFNIFLNLIGTGCKIGELDWVSTFVKKYSKSVDPQNEDKIKILGKAYLAYYEGDYSSSLVLLRGYDHPSFKLQFRARWLQLTSNYEIYKDDIYLILSLIKSFETFLKSKKITVSKTSIKGMQNTLSILKKMLRPYKKSKIQSLIESKKIVFNRKWLLDKI